MKLYLSSKFINFFSLHFSLQKSLIIKTNTPPMVGVGHGAPPSNNKTLIMVTVKNFKQRQSKESGEFFNVLVLQGDVAPVKSTQTGRMYFTAKTCSVPCTFDDETCKSIIGSTFPGQIVKVECDEYDFAIPETGEVIQLSHRWEYYDPAFEGAPVNVLEEDEVM